MENNILKKLKWVLMMGIIFTLTMNIIPIVAMASSFGEDTYNYLRYINDNHPERIAGTDAEWSMGDYLIEQLESFGYVVNIDGFTYNEQHSRNIIALKAGTSDKEIVVGAHYDSVNTCGADDNGSGVATVLELAKQYSDKDTPCSIRFIFWGYEEAGMIGSMNYVVKLTQNQLDNTLAVINLDSIIAGDNRYIHGGVIDEGGNLQQDWLLNIALDISNKYYLGMTTHPDVENIPSPTRVNGSDQMYWARAGIPYIYLEANVYSDEVADGNPVHYQTMNEEVPGGQIMHTQFDNLDVIESIFPNRPESNLIAYYTLCDKILSNLLPDGSMQNTSQENADVLNTKTADSEAVETKSIYENNEVSQSQVVTTRANVDDIDILSTKKATENQSETNNEINKNQTTAAPTVTATINNDKNIVDDIKSDLKNMKTDEDDDNLDKSSNLTGTEIIGKYFKKITSGIFSNKIIEMGLLIIAIIIVIILIIKISTPKNGDIDKKKKKTNDKYSDVDSLEEMNRIFKE